MGFEEKRRRRAGKFGKVNDFPSRAFQRTAQLSAGVMEGCGNIKYGNTVIMVTHNEAIRHMADHVIKLRDGEVRHNEINTDKVSAADLEW